MLSNVSWGVLGNKEPSGGFRDSSAQNHFGPGLLGPDVSPIFQSGTARPTLVGLLGPFFYFLFIFFGGGGGNLLFYSVYVH